MALLEKIKKPSDVKKLSLEELDVLAEEIRNRIIEVVSENGGHLASSLGAVDLIVALYYVYDFEEDKLVFDVGHQSYAHKILSGRNDEFDTLRKNGGISGFPLIDESVYDAFSAGHAGNSVSASLGYCAARDLRGEKYNVVDVVGDASLFNGENLEAITGTDKKPSNFLIILNDNGMSISKNDNGFYKLFSKITTKRSYGKFMSALNKIFGNGIIGRGLKKFKNFVKINMNHIAIIDKMGLKYLGVFDGHKIPELVKILAKIKEGNKSVLLHVRTVKGKGYKDAEESAEVYHGVGKNLQTSRNDFSRFAGEILVKKATEDERLTAICAGMKSGVGLTEFAEKFPKRFFDVGISEEHAVTFAAGQALGNARPVVCIYSTFLQRSYDQIMQDICMQNLPVIFFVDRSGFVGADGITHQGLFDFSYLRSMPNMKIFAPKNAEEFSSAFEYAYSLSSPCAICYPNGAGYEFSAVTPFSESLWEKYSEGENMLLCVGPRMLALAEEVARSSGKSVGIVNARTVKPLDEKTLDLIKDKRIITLEENVVAGGFGGAVLEYFAGKGVLADVRTFGVGDEFVPHGSVEEQLERCGLTVKNVSGALK